MAYFVRHPQYVATVQEVNGPLDGPLTPRGIWQAKKTARRCATLRINRILSSPAYRCKYLADLIGEYTNIPIEVCRELRERDYGALEGFPGSYMFALGIAGRPENGESVIEVQQRARQLYDLTKPDERTLIISHGLFLKLFTGHMLRLETDTALRTLKFSNCAISNITPERIEFLNDRGHLGTPAKRIHIFGGWAAGKTTLARELAAQFGCEAFSLDDMKYTNGFSHPTSVKERIRRIDEVTTRESWITEGSWTNYASVAFERADALIYVRTPLHQALLNAARREVARSRQPGVSFWKLSRELVKYHCGHATVSRQAHDDFFTKYQFKAAMSTSLSTIEFPEDILLCEASIGHRPQSC
jgi:probable phosphoglycerate mutase